MKVTARRLRPIGALALLGVGCSGGSEPAREPAPASASQAPPSMSAAPAAPAAQPTGADGPTASASPSTAPAAPAPPACPAGMARVEGGSFKSSYFKKEMSVGAFCLDVNEATADQYAVCVDAGKCDKKLVTICDPSTFGAAGKGSLPMVCVDFGQAEAYCKGGGKRLPSDLEWEWAARGGGEARTFPWGNDAPAEQLCWSGKAKRDGPCPIGTFPGGASPQGILDLSGNVYEWTTTSNDATSAYRVGRGGSWKDGTPDVFKVTRPGSFKTTYRCGFLGIRCATSS